MSKEPTKNRDEMARDRDYVAGDTFMSRITWHANTYMGPKMLFNRAAASPMRCSLVGLVSPDRLAMEPHGDFDPLSSPSTKLSDAYFRISLVSPNEILNPNRQSKLFAEDFDLTIKRVLDLSSVLPDKGVKIDSFIERKENLCLIKFSRRVFQKLTRFGPDNREPVRPTYLSAYRIRPDLKHLLNAMRRSFMAKNYALWDARGLSFPVEKRNAMLQNRLVRIYFYIRFDPEEGLVAEFNTVSAFSIDLTTEYD